MTVYLGSAGQRTHGAQFDQLAPSNLTCGQFRAANHVVYRGFADAQQPRGSSFGDQERFQLGIFGHGENRISQQPFFVSEMKKRRFLNFVAEGQGRGRTRDAS